MQFRRLLEKLPTAAYTCDPEGLITFFNEGAVRLWGRTPELNDPVHRYCGSLRLFATDGTPIPHDQCWMALALSGETEYNGREIVVERPDGQRVTALAHANPIRDETGKVQGAVNVLVDITERKQAEEAALRAKEEAERANAAKSDFMSRMSHELRTPLNAILGFGQLLESEQTNPENADSLEQIVRGGRHLLSLINEVLGIAEVEAGVISLSPEPVDIREIIEETLDLVRRSAIERDITFELGACSACALADPQRLKQVLLNLFSNAVKYNRLGGNVLVGCEVVRPGTVRINVTDTGPGMDTADVKMLFTPFERLQAARTGIEGIGLGLSISERLIELMDGKIGVQSVLGEGTLFWIELPTAELPAASAVATTAAPPLISNQKSEISNSTRVLYIEDDAANLKLVQRILARRPAIEMIGASHGRIGIALAQRRLPHLILLDLHLPDMLGDAVIGQLRADPRTQHIPVVMISADATPAQMAQLRAAGAVEYLTKPINVQDLLATVDHFANATA